MPKKGGHQYIIIPQLVITQYALQYTMRPVKKKDSKIYRKPIDKKKLTYENKSMKLPEMIQTRSGEWGKRRGGEIPYISPLPGLPSGSNRGSKKSDIRNL